MEQSGKSEYAIKPQWNGTQFHCRSFGPLFGTIWDYLLQPDSTSDYYSICMVHLLSFELCFPAALHLSTFLLLEKGIAIGLCFAAVSLKSTEWWVMLKLNWLNFAFYRMEVLLLCLSIMMTMESFHMSPTISKIAIYCALFSLVVCRATIVSVKAEAEYSMQPIHRFCMTGIYGFVNYTKYDELLSTLLVLVSLSPTTFSVPVFLFFVVPFTETMSMPNSEARFTM